jgi:general secretion pathway protein A
MIRVAGTPCALEAKDRMYQAYWGLGCSPFRGHLDARFFHQGPTQEEALARLHFLADERRTLGLLLADAGSGKSQLLQVFAAQLNAASPAAGQRRTALVNLAAVDAGEFLWLLAGPLGVEAVPSANPATLWRAVAYQVAANRYQEVATVLLLDDADLARAEIVDQIVRLAQLDDARDAWLTMVLAAQPRRLGRLGARILELADLRIDLDGWDADNTAAFIKQAINKAGRSSPIFSEAAGRRIHELSGGLPRRVKQLADLSLLAGAGNNLVQIEADTVEAVCHELGVLAPAAPAFAPAAAAAHG